MKILLVGNGAREHAIAEAVARSPQKPGLYAFMTAKNPGISRLSEKTGIGDICNPRDVLEFAGETGIDIAVIGPEAPLDAGVVDELEDDGIPCVGPRRNAAKLETDKSFARRLMGKYGIEGTPKFGIFSDADEAAGFFKESNDEWVIKPVGLTGGKGVKVMGEHLNTPDDAEGYVREVLGKDNEVVIEEKLIGEEFTIQAFVDGTTVLGSPMVQDHKRAYEGDVGPNTGGMGSYSDRGYILPFLTQDDYDQGIGIMQSVVDAVRKETSTAYKGFLYGQFIATSRGLYVVEFNARFGDPEAMNVLPLLRSDFVDICTRVADGTLNELDGLKFEPKATVCKYMVPEGYPEQPKSNVKVDVDEDKIKELGGRVYYASVSEDEGTIYTSSSRAIAVVGAADSIYEAEKIAEGSMEYIHGELFHRKDIGTRELIKKRIEHMKSIRK